MTNEAAERAEKLAKDFDNKITTTNRTGMFKVIMNERKLRPRANKANYTAI